MAQNISDSPITRPQGAQVPTLNLLPIRGDKSIIPSPVNSSTAATKTANRAGIGQLSTPTQSVNGTTFADAFSIAAALEPLTDFISVRLQNRGLDMQGNPDPTQDAIFRFLINPQTLNINHQTLDQQAFLRGGWQFGVWGDDFVRITMSGKTAGEYFVLGLTGGFAEFTESYRNLTQLQLVVENNGYWYEGEQAIGSSNALTPSFARRIIKMQQDVILTAKEFIWNGMFESIEVQQDSELPFLASFSVSFIAWKERFRSDSPYYDSKHSDLQLGNSYQAFSALTRKQSVVTPTDQTSVPTSSMTAPAPAPSAQNGSTPVQAAEHMQTSLSTTSPLANDTNPMGPIFKAETSYQAWWLGEQD